MFRYINRNTFEFGQHRFLSSIGSYNIMRSGCDVTLSFTDHKEIVVTVSYGSAKDALLVQGCLRIATRGRKLDEDIIFLLVQRMLEGTDEEFRDCSNYRVYYNCAETLYVIDASAIELHKKLVVDSYAKEIDKVSKRFDISDLGVE